MAIGPAASGDLLVCIANDPRWDSQIDSRDDYYARLVLALGINFDALTELLWDADPRTPEEARQGHALVLDVLGRLATLEGGASIDVLRRYVETGHFWADALSLLSYDNATWDPSPDWRRRIEGLDAVLCRRFLSTAELVAALEEHWGEVDVERLPWSEWSGSNREMREALGQWAAAQPAGPPVRHPPIESLSTAQLLALADPSDAWFVAKELARRTRPDDVAAMAAAAKDSNVPMHAPAVQALAQRGRVDVLPAVLAFNKGVRPAARRRHLFKAFVALPYEATRETAREWLVAGDDHARRRVASSALAKHAVLGDVELVRLELRREFDAGLDGDQFVICSLAEALGRHPAAGPYVELDRAFRGMPYSYGRRFVGAAIAATDPRFAAGLATDCLWDAEETVRTIGARHAVRDAADVAARLRELRDDSHEDPGVREAAG